MKVRYADLGDNLLGRAFLETQKGKLLGKFKTPKELIELLKLYDEHKNYPSIIIEEHELYEDLGQIEVIEININKPLIKRLEGWLHELLERLFARLFFDMLFRANINYQEVFDWLWNMIYQHNKNTLHLLFCKACRKHYLSIGVFLDGQTGQCGQG